VIPLAIAILHENLELVEMLLASTPDIKLEDESFGALSVLELSQKFGKTHQIKSLLASYQTNPKIVQQILRKEQGFSLS